MLKRLCAIILALVISVSACGIGVFAADGSETCVTASVKKYNAFTVKKVSGQMAATASVNVRTGPSTEYKRLGTLSKNQKITVTGVTDNGWYRTDYKGKTGYVSGKYLKGKVKTPKEDKNAEAVKTGRKNTDLPQVVIDNGLDYIWSCLDSDERDNVERLLEAMRDCKEATFDRDVTVSEIDDLALLVLDNTPGYCHVTGSYRYWYNSSKIITKVTFDCSGKNHDDCDEKNKKVAEKVAKIIKDCPEGTERDVIRYIHDYLVNNIKYDTDFSNENKYNAYGALIDGEAVCQGYTNAAQLLLSAAGFESLIISGKADGAAHAWNLVRLSDGKWYNLDVTWDDPLDYNGREIGVVYSYFLISDDDISKTHIRGEGSALFDWPEAE